MFPKSAPLLKGESFTWKIQSLCLRGELQSLTNIWLKFTKSSEIGFPMESSMADFFFNFLMLLPDFHFWREDWALQLILTLMSAVNFVGFPEFPNFLRFQVFF